MENNMDLTNNEIFKLGMLAGWKQLEEHAIHQYQMGKPLKLQGELFWLKDDRQNLSDIMDDIENIWNEENGVKNFIVPIMRYYYDKEIIREVIISAEEPEQALVIAINEFQYDGWDIDTDCENYKVFKGQVKVMGRGRPATGVPKEFIKEYNKFQSGEYGSISVVQFAKLQGIAVSTFYKYTGILKGRQISEKI